MNSITIAFLLTSIAGLSTLLGTLPIFINIKNENKIIASSLSFAAGVMICMSIFDLIPESISMLKNNYSIIGVISLSFLFILLGIIIFSYIEREVPSNNNESLYKVGIISMLAIMLHNIPEGIATFILTTKDVNLGISMSLAIAIHNIPEGVSIAVPIYYATKKRGKALIYTLVSSLSESLGAILTFLFLLPIINDIFLGLLFSFIAGIMLYISFFNILPTSISYKEKGLTKLFFVIGVVFMLLKYFV